MILMATTSSSSTLKMLHRGRSHLFRSHKQRPYHRSILLTTAGGKPFEQEPPRALFPWISPERIGTRVSALACHPQYRYQQHTTSNSNSNSCTRGYTSSSKEEMPNTTNRVPDDPSRSGIHKNTHEEESTTPGSRAFVECDRNALLDLFYKYAKECSVSGKSLDKPGLAKLLKAVGEHLDEDELEELFQASDLDNSGAIDLEEFLHGSDMILGNAPAGIVLVVGGPGSGKGVLSKRLEEECGVVHLSSGDLLREEVRRDTVLGRQVQSLMERGELVSSAVIVTLMRRVMRNHPGKRVLLDGFPRSLQNAHDLVELCGTPQLALHLECDDTILMERILKRGGNGERADDNIHTALKRLRTYHKYHNSTLDWLRQQHVPVVNLDCSGDPESVWEQLCAIGRLMRPATRIEGSGSGGAAANNSSSSNDGPPPILPTGSTSSEPASSTG